MAETPAIKTKRSSPFRQDLPAGPTDARATELDWLRCAAPDLNLNGPRSAGFRPVACDWTERPAIALFAEAAARFPQAAACEDIDRQISFDAMWKAARRLAWRIDETIPLGRPVGVLLPNQAMYPAAVLACLAAARPCVLIDRNYPADRVAAVIGDAGLTGLVLAQADIAAGYPLPTEAITLAVEDAFVDAKAPADMPVGPVPVDSASFIVYTSGSTGRPKGIVLSQRAVLHRAAELVDAVHLNHTDKVLSLASPGTIGGLQQIFEVMLTGATLVKLDLQRVGLGQVLQAVAHKRITMMFSTPAVWRSVAQLDGAREALASLRCIQSSGDILLRVDHDLIRTVLAPGCAVLSVYGATEAPALLQWFVQDPPPEESRIPVGYPLPDIDFALVDEQGAPAAEGEVGELVVRSAFTSLGLWRDGAVVPEPFDIDPARPDLKIYRTGDLARRRPDGLFVVLGRRDRQVKIRGNRVELAEIETALRATPGVRDSAVIVHRTAAEPLVVGFVVPNSDASPGLADEVRAGIARRLPAYMRPKQLHVLETLPLLHGRKVDEAALQSLAASFRGRAAAEAQGVGGGTSAKAMVDRAWRAAVGRPPRPGQSFDEAGGDSLGFLQMLYHIERLAGRALPLEQLHAELDADSIALALDRTLVGEAPTFGADAPVIFFFPPSGDTDRFLAGFCRAVADRVPLRVLNYPGVGVLARPDASLETIAAHAVRQIDREKPEGRLVIAGYSAGSDVAYAALGQLRSSGRQVALLGVFDTDVTGIPYPAPPAPPRSPAARLSRLWRGLRRGYWLRLASMLLTDELFARPAARRATGLLVALDPPIPESWKLVLSTIVQLRLFQRLHTDWLTGRTGDRVDTPVLLFRSAEPRPPGVPRDLGWSNRADRIDVVDVRGDHQGIFQAEDHDLMVRELVSATLQAHRREIGSD